MENQVEPRCAHKYDYWYAGVPIDLRNLLVSYPKSMGFGIKQKCEEVVERKDFP